MQSPAHAGQGETTICQVGGHRFRIAEMGVAARDTADVLHLFVAAFQQSPSPEWHVWKYAVGGGEAVGLWQEDGRLVAHYAGFPRELRWRGQPVAAIQIGDVMVAPEVRGLLTRKGPFFQVCWRFFTSRVGAGKKYRLAFGFPNERHLRLGMALDLYHDAGTIRQVSWPARQTDLPWNWRWAPLAEEALEKSAGCAWHSMARDFSDCVVGVRDAAYVRQRFLNRPDRRYRIFCLRRWPFGGVEALAVMRIEPAQAELLDVIGPRSAFPLVAQAAATEAARAGAPMLTAWASPLVQTLCSNSGAEVGGTVAHLAVARASDFAAEEVANAPWWWMGGDTDFL